MMISQKLNLQNYGIGWHIQKEQEKKCSLAKNQADSANWQGDIGKHCYAPMTPYKSF